MQIQNNLTLTLFLSFRGFTLGFGNFLASPLCQNWQFTCFVRSSFHFGIGCSLWTVFLCAKGPSFFVSQSSLKLPRQKICFQIGVLFVFLCACLTPEGRKSEREFLKICICWSVAYFLQYLSAGLDDDAITKVSIANVSGKELLGGWHQDFENGWVKQHVA